MDSPMCSVTLGWGSAVAISQCSHKARVGLALAAGAALFGKILLNLPNADVLPRHAAGLVE